MYSELPYSIVIKLISSIVVKAWIYKGEEGHKLIVTRLNFIIIIVSKLLWNISAYFEGLTELWFVHST